MQEMLVKSLGHKDSLEEEMAIHSSTLAWEIPWTEEPGGLQSLGSQIVGHALETNHTHTCAYTEMHYIRHALLRKNS